MYLINHNLHYNRSITHDLCAHKKCNFIWKSRLFYSRHYMIVQIQKFFEKKINCTDFCLVKFSKVLSSDKLRLAAQSPEAVKTWPQGWTWQQVRYYLKIKLIHIKCHVFDWIFMQSLLLMKARQTELLLKMHIVSVSLEKSKNQLAISDLFSLLFAPATFVLWLFHTKTLFLIWILILDLTLNLKSNCNPYPNPGAIEPGAIVTVAHVIKLGIPTYKDLQSCNSISIALVWPTVGETNYILYILYLILSEFLMKSSQTMFGRWAVTSAS